MQPKVRLAISTCPNDTFAFHALMHRLVDWNGVQFEIELLDIQTLNEGLFAGRFDVAKASFHAALLLADDYWVLPSGSALGFGVGPLLLASQRNTRPSHSKQLTLCPGKHTTAALLFQLFYPQTTRIEHVVFSQIMPELKKNGADFGVCIHEGRFTWEQEGLALVEDLGVRWEEETNLPLPLGGIIAAKKLEPQILHAVQATIRNSLEYARMSRKSPLPTMRQYAQEFDDDVLMKHVELYVNDWTLDLGPIGQAALDQLSSRAKEIGLISKEQARLAVLD